MSKKKIDSPLQDVLKHISKTFGSDVDIAISEDDFRGEFRYFIHQAKDHLRKAKMDSPISAFVYKSPLGNVRMQLEFKNIPALAA